MKYGYCYNQDYTKLSGFVKWLTNMLILKPMVTETELQNQRLGFKMWLELMYVDWMAKNKKRATLDEFAEYIGYSRPLISLWLAGKRLPLFQTPGQSSEEP